MCRPIGSANYRKKALRTSRQDTLIQYDYPYGSKIVFDRAQTLGQPLARLTLEENEIPGFDTEPRVSYTHVSVPERVCVRFNACSTREPRRCDDRSGT